LTGAVLPRDNDSGTLAAMKKVVLLACLGLPLSLFGQGGLPDKPYIYVEGRAEIEKQADMVTLRFDLATRNPDQAKANQEVQAKANKIFALLKERKIAENDVDASDIKSEPQFEINEESGRKGKLTGYKVTRTFVVKVREIQAFAQLVDELMAIAGVEFSGIEPGLSTEKEVRAEILEKALTDARTQAEKTLQAVGMKIDSIFAVSPFAIADISSRLLPSSSTERVVVTGSYIPTGGDRVASQYRIAPLSVKENMNVIFLISPAK
jgi:uncharacterized protein